MAFSHVRMEVPPANKGGFGKRQVEIEGIRRKNASILIVDDDEDLREITGMVLQDAGFRIRMAANGREGFDAYTRGGIDLVVSDLHMPEMSGLEMLEAIKKLDPKAKVIMCSGGANDNEVARLISAGALKVFTKPVELGVLEAAIESAI
jgi:DNA-binding NtrC family response regulator